MPSAPGHVAIVGAGWAGCTAALAAQQLGWRVSLLEAARDPGGRARSVALSDTLTMDNGQHILIGAYASCLQMMLQVGVDPSQVLHREPLDLRTPDGRGLRMPPASALPTWDLLRAIWQAQGWSLAAKLSLLRVAARWQHQGYRCDNSASVLQVCRGLHADILQDLVTPLCVSAFNSQPEHTSGRVFLRVIHDALMAQRGGSDALVARVPLGQVLPEPAVRWLQTQGAEVRLGCRVQGLEPLQANSPNAGWQLQLDDSSQLQADRVILATPAPEAARLLQQMQTVLCEVQHSRYQRWMEMARQLQWMPIATTYAWCPLDDAARLPRMQALAGSPAQFVFSHPEQDGIENGQRLLAFVASCSKLPRDAHEQAILQQAQAELGLSRLTLIRTLVDKRATFVCSADVQRPPMQILPGLRACGDYVEGDYPATLEGAVRSGLQAAQSLSA